MSQTAMSCVERVYHGVIEDVINGVREHFIEEGVDEQVLTELKQAWEAKLARMNVLDHSDHTSTVNSNQQQTQQSQQQQQQTQQQQQQQPQQQQQAAPQQPQQPAAGKLNNGAAPPPPTATTVNLVPVQITVPAQQAGGVPKTITIHVPSTALANGVAGQQLQAILSSPTAAHTFSLEASRAAEIIQRKLNVALEENGITLPAQLLQYNNISNNQVDGACDEPICPTPDKKISKKNTLPTTARCPRNQPSTSSADSQVSVNADKDTVDQIIYERLKATQVDGQYGTGDSSSEISDDDDDDEDDKDAETEKNSIDGDEDEEDAEGVEEEPLNSEDDVSDDDTSDMFDTENVVVCQYDKITRVRNKWKFTLKDGIMNLRGKDYVFQKATGDGEW